MGERARMALEAALVRGYSCERAEWKKGSRGEEPAKRERARDAARPFHVKRQIDRTYLYPAVRYIQGRAP